MITRDRRNRPRGRRRRRRWDVLLAIALICAFVGSLPAGCNGHKPKLQPDQTELILKEGDALEITCTSAGEVNFYYPEDDSAANVTTSEHRIHESKINDEVILKFRRSSTVFGDTGWYGCADVNDRVTNKDYNDPNASWLYVYVTSNVSAFVQTADFQIISAPADERIVLPCLPTSPRLHVVLNRNYQELKPNKNLSYDPKIGYVIKSLQLKDSDFYTCEVDDEQFSQIMTLHVKAIRKDSLSKPTIDNDGLQHVTVGSNLRVRCTVRIGVENSYTFFWTTPRNSSSRRIMEPVVKKDQQTYNIVTSELIEDQVTYDDEGEYTCMVQSKIDSKSTTVYVHVYDPSVKYINLTTDEDNRHRTVHVGDQVTFRAHLDAYPTPALVWFGTDNQEIPSISTRIMLNNTKTTSELLINGAQIHDMGIYALQASNEDEVKRMNFSLEVHAKPWALLDTTDMKTFYSLNENATFLCQVLGYPPSSVTWFYTSCPKFQSDDGCWKTELEATETGELSVTKIYSKVKVTMTTFGKINCTACNIHDCDSVEQNIFVTDGIPDATFGIIEPKDKLTEGDNVTLICAAVNYNFSTVTWINDRDLPIEDSDRIKVTLEDTNFTHRAALTIVNLQRSDEIDYYCRANDLDGLPSRTSYLLTLEEPQKPRFTYVNMNDTEITITTLESHKTIHLLCYVEGMPRPTVNWYKNEEPLETTEQQFTLVSRDQELIIKYLLEQDSGKYSCLAKNRFGEVQKFQKFIVKGMKIPRLLIAMISSLIIILTILLIYFCLKVRHEKKLRKQLLEAGLMHFEEGALDCINPDLTVDDQAELLPYDRKWEFPREKVKLGKQLGSGAFGVVMKAQAYGIRDDEPCTTVAVKMVRKSAEPVYMRALASELKIMVHLGKHLNVVNLLGACTKNIAKRELLVIVEFCRFGNLQNYLLRHRDNFIDQIDQSTYKIDPSIGKGFFRRGKSLTSSFSPSSNFSTASSTEPVIYYADTQDLGGRMESCNRGFVNSDSQPGWRSNYEGDYKDKNLEPICTQDLLSWAFQVARGMEYLCRRKVMHGDLAARNILLAENNVVKICDFGLAKTMYKDDNYKKQGNGPVPIKWMAIESIRDRVFSTKSDVWSYGIVLWELFTLAETPYASMEVEKQYQKLNEGYRMERPKYATKDIYDVMLRCWEAEPSARPSFADLADGLGDLLDEGVKMIYVEMNSMYENMNKSINIEGGKNDYLGLMSSPDHVTSHDYANGRAKTTTTPAYLSITNESPLMDGRKITLRSGLTSPIDEASMPMLVKKPEPEQDDDNYLKPIDVNKRREEFVKRREAEKIIIQAKQHDCNASAGDNTTINDRDSGYCNTPRTLEPMGNDDTDGKGTTTRDNYVNMNDRGINERNKLDEATDNFTNPSYMFVESARSDTAV